MVADREHELAKLETKIEQLQLTRERQALKTAELEKTVETLTQQRDAQDSAAAEAASRLSDDVRTLRLALDDISRREREVCTVMVAVIYQKSKTFTYEISNRQCTFLMASFPHYYCRSVSVARCLESLEWMFYNEIKT